MRAETPRRQYQNTGQRPARRHVTASGPARSDFVDIRSVRPNVPAPAPGVRRLHRHLHQRLRPQPERKTQPRQRHRRAGCEQWRPPYPRLRRKPGDGCVLQRRRSRPGRHQLPRSGRQVHLLLARRTDPEPGQRRRREGGRRRQGQERRKDSDPGAGHDHLWSDSGEQGHRDAAVPADHHGRRQGVHQRQGECQCLLELHRLREPPAQGQVPPCPQGSEVVRTFKFQSCWDGRTPTAPTTAPMSPSRTNGAPAPPDSRRSPSSCSASSTTSWPRPAPSPWTRFPSSSTSRSPITVTSSTSSAIS